MRKLRTFSVEFRRLAKEQLGQRFKQLKHVCLRVRFRALGREAWEEVLSVELFGHRGFELHLERFGCTGEVN